jgi:D-alanine transaminase
LALVIGERVGDTIMTSLRTVYLNGEYMCETQAKVSIFDRGFLMADGVYEVTAVLDGKLIDFDGHVQRLQRSLKELDMMPVVIPDDLLHIHRELIRRNHLQEGLIYLQVTRGAPADRDFLFPDPKTVRPTIVVFPQFKPGLANNNTMVQKGLRIISISDLRWARRDIKTVQLLYASMGKMMANAAAVDDAWMVEDNNTGRVTEGTSHNAYIIKNNTIITRPLGNEILKGITRAAVLRLAQETSLLQVEERRFTIEEAQQADEAFITSASTFVMPVVEIDGVQVGAGVPGPLVLRLRAIYVEECRKTAI